MKRSNFLKSLLAILISPKINIEGTGKSFENQPFQDYTKYNEDRTIHSYGSFNGEEWTEISKDEYFMKRIAYYNRRFIIEKESWNLKYKVHKTDGI